MLKDTWKVSATQWPQKNGFYPLPMDHCIGSAVYSMAHMLLTFCSWMLSHNLEDAHHACLWNMLL